MMRKDLTLAVVGGAKTREEGIWWKRNKGGGYRGSPDGFLGCQLTAMQLLPQTRLAQTSAAPEAKWLHC